MRRRSLLQFLAAAPILKLLPFPVIDDDLPGMMKRAARYDIVWPAEEYKLFEQEPPSSWRRQPIQQPTTIPFLDILKKLKP